MSVTDFECAIAKSQIARYIAGENLAPEVARHLETHISACPRCKQLLQEKKSSLEAMIVDKPEALSTVQIPSEPVPMVSGTLALKPEPAPTASVQAEPSELTEARQSLRQKLREQARALSSKEDATIDIPIVAPAFAHKDNPQGGIKLSLETGEEAKPTKKKKGFSLSSLALYRRVSDEVQTEQPSMTIENLKTAKESLKGSPSGFRKPMFYLVGLCAVIAAMSFFLKDPTSLFGGKAAAQDLLVKEKPAKPATLKKTPKLTNASVKRQSVLGDNVTNAESFAPSTPTNDPKPVAKKKAPAKKFLLTKKPVAKKLATKPTLKTAKGHEVMKKPVAKSTFKKTSKKAQAHAHAKPKTNQNAVKLYAPDSAATKEQN